MPNGKAAGEVCVQLDASQRCRIFGSPLRPAVCSTLMPARDMCGETRADAMHWLGQLELATLPASAPAVLQ